MNKLTKIGVSALCGSLASIASAQAGSMSATGSAFMTYVSHDYGNTGNPLGMASGLTFAGSGELDNGGTFTVTFGHSDKNTYDTSQVAYTSPSMGTFTYDEGGGTGLDRIDDMIPTAWEETNGTSVGTGMTTVAGAGGSTDIEWALPASMLPDGVTAHFAYAPKPDGSAANDKTGGGDKGGNVTGKGWDLVIQHSGLYDGLNVFGGYSVIEQTKSDPNASGDRTQYALGATYAVGSLTLGYEYSRDNLANQAAAGTSYYENNMYGASFAVNDDLSLSVGIAKSEAFKNTATSVELEALSFQAAYTMGGAAIKFANTTVDQAEYVSGTGADRGGYTLAVSLAF